MTGIGKKMMCKLWELWWASFLYEDSNQSKRRPVLIIKIDNQTLYCAKVTSHIPRDQWYEYEIIKWQTAGLSEPSTVRLSQFMKLTEGDLDARIGQLHGSDILLIKEKLNFL